MRPRPRTQKHFEARGHEMVLIATRSSSQPTLRFPPAEFVHGDEEVEEVAIGPLGVLYTYTVVHPGKGVEPYALAMVDFEPGVRAFGRLCGPLQPAPAIDSTVRVVPFALADGTPDYAFEVVQGDQA